VTNQLGLSPIVGYPLAGIAVGPNAPGFNAGVLPPTVALADQDEPTLDGVVALASSE
jgi:predicted Kef-type K+ transport protein